MKLVTHSGRFHYDEILSTSMLLRLYPDATLTRTRDNSVIATGDIVYDVGGAFDPEARRFDHHQAGFFETFSEKYSIKLSSSGLVFKYFHRELLSLYGIEPASPIYSLVVDKAYSEFFLHADAIDNGYDIYGEIRPRNISDVVNLFNSDATGDEEDRRFHDVLRIVDLDMHNYMSHLAAWTRDYESAEDAVRSTEGSILILEKHYSTSLILELEDKHGRDFRFMVFPSNEKYKVIAIPKARGSFETKNPLRMEWRGLRDEELSRVSGIACCVFVHASGFLGINETLAGALKMCEESLDR